MRTPPPASPAVHTTLGGRGCFRLATGMASAESEETSANSWRIGGPRNPTWYAFLGHSAA